jgi:arginine metabolism regulation protein II
MIKGDSEKRLSCLIQAERFISVNGFTQTTVSSKRRALHHCYAYMRIMAETTSIDSLCANMASTNISDEDSSQAAFRIYPGVTFSGDIMAMEKDPNVAQRDLHLAIPGSWSLTLFPEMYGVTESFLMLLSQVIRLANERDLSMTEDRTGGLDLKEFWIRAKVLEKGIHLLVSSCPTGKVLVDSLRGESQFESARAQAMYTALLVYFHRRIYDLDAALLQREVDAVEDSLIRAQEAADRHYGSTATLIWPAFIAACEAVRPESELFFSSWFDSCYAATGLRDVSLAKQVFEIIWTKRRENGPDGCSWPEILRTNKIRLMFI